MRIRAAGCKNGGDKLDPNVELGSRSDAENPELHAIQKTSARDQSKKRAACKQVMSWSLNKELRTIHNTLAAMAAVIICTGTACLQGQVAMAICTW